MITGQNLLLLAVRHDRTDEFIDHLLEQNISATEYDLRRCLSLFFSTEIVLTRIVVGTSFT